MIAGLLGLITRLVQAIGMSLAACGLLAVTILLIVLRFALEVARHALEILKRMAPALLRAGCVGLFIAGLVAGALGVGWLYQDLTDLPGGVLVAAALAWLLIANVVWQKEHIWSAQALSGAVGLALYGLLPYCETNSDFRFAARGVPVTLATAGMIYLMFRFRRTKGEIHHGNTIE